MGFGLTVERCFRGFAVSGTDHSSEHVLSEHHLSRVVLYLEPKSPW